VPDYNTFYVMLLNILRPAMKVLVQICFANDNL